MPKLSNLHATGLDEEVAQLEEAVRLQINRASAVSVFENSLFW